MNRASAAALGYACSISSDVTAVHFAVDDQVAQDFQQQWKRWANDVPLLLVPITVGIATEPRKISICRHIPRREAALLEHGSYLLGDALCEDACRRRDQCALHACNRLFALMDHAVLYSMLLYHTNIYYGMRNIRALKARGWALHQEIETVGRGLKKIQRARRKA